MNSLSKFIVAVFTIVFAIALYSNCTGDEAKQPTTDQSKTEEVAPKSKYANVKVPRFGQDSAYLYIQNQVDFGPRMPNTEAHGKTKVWLVEKMKSFGAEVIEQDFKAKAYTGEQLNGTNIIAQFNPENKDRILLCAHWDTRHISDHDPDLEDQSKPVLGADDGGSGVGVLLEIARQLQANPIGIGIDLVLFDLEDYGQGGGGSVESWCLGSQYWSRNLHAPDYRPRFGILLDMVGSKGARFTKEGLSRSFAPKVTQKVWALAKGMGFGATFVDVNTPELIDDHYFVNKIAKIPTIDIINRQENTPSGFGHYWHTQDDTMDIISKRTLRAAGQTVLAVVYQTNNGNFL